ncbi:hypothetical protein [uncultured Thiodictyon sp.]|uniref:hypothetical protein n=1 Tax=uncultured Thiodictyon sp. TaxID=1846217 RepID=UPI0025F56548|nr:hypothetical protein [uncultured Thiodictyon sp.]
MSDPGRLTIDVSHGPDGDTASSLWGGLSKHLIASFYPVSKASNGVWSKPDAAATVKAPLTEASMEVALNWHSPFENMGAEAKAPMLAAMLQSGAIAPVAQALVTGAPAGGVVAGLAEGAQSALSGMQGRTGITKLNSTQVFSGMPPAKLQVTVLLRAWSDPLREVETPFNQLMDWALPMMLSPDDPLAMAIKCLAKGVTGGFGSFADAAKGAVDVLMPSKAPVCVAMRYKGRIYSPLVIEAITDPIGSNVDASGRYVEKLFSMTLCTLTAIDRQDWAGMATSL